LAIAKKNDIPAFTNLAEAIEASRPCIAFNLTGDESTTAYAGLHLGNGNIVGGFPAHFLWKLLTSLKQTNEQITHLAHHDVLTGLPNRILFYDRLNHAISGAHRNKTQLAVLFLDLDGFKQINDTLGHDAGDELLRMAAKRIQACVRESDTVARMGGDEFTIILCDVHTPNGQDNVAKKIIEAMASPFMINGKNCSVSASIGIALYPDNGVNADQLLKIADAAMYLAKNSGKNCYRLAGQ
jgi:diguanylate cyclase (GGDEF)-like protein